MKVTLSNEQFENIKHVIFGLQKQANVQNEAVIKLIAEGVTARGYLTDMSSEAGVTDGLKKFIQSCIDNPTETDAIVITLLCGEESFINLTTPGPCVMSVDVPNPESPKTLFRIVKLGAEAEVTREVNYGAGPTLTPPRSSAENSSSIQPDNYKTRVEDLVKKILPLVPDGVKTELSDPYQQCLCCAEYYYNL